MDEFSTNWPMANAAVELGQGMTPFSDNSEDLQIMGTFATSSIHPVDNLHNLQNSETISSNYFLSSWSWNPPISTDFMTTTEKPGQHPVLESKMAQFPFCWDNLSGSQIFEPAGYQSINTGAQSTGSLEAYNISPWQLDSMTSSSTTCGDFPQLASISSTFGFLSEHTSPNAFLSTTALRHLQDFYSFEISVRRSLCLELKCKSQNPSDVSYFNLIQVRARL
jgi:hypothetical protein